MKRFALILLLLLTLFSCGNVEDFRSYGVSVSGDCLLITAGVVLNGEGFRIVGFDGETTTLVGRIVTGSAK